MPDLVQYAAASKHTGQLLELPDLSSIYGCQMPNLVVRAVKLGCADDLLWLTATCLQYSL